jgi:hypothetical protein
MSFIIDRQTVSVETMPRSAQTHFGQRFTSAVKPANELLPLVELSLT